MMKDIVEVRALEGRRLYLRFEDGVAGEVDPPARTWIRTCSMLA